VDIARAVGPRAPPFLSTESSQSYGDHVEDGPVHPDAEGCAGITRSCAEHRTTYLGFMVMLTVPATVLFTLACVPAGTARREPSAA